MGKRIFTVMFWQTPAETDARWKDASVANLHLDHCELLEGSGSHPRPHAGEHLERCLATVITNDPQWEEFACVFISLQLKLANW